MGGKQKKMIAIQRRAVRVSNTKVWQPSRPATASFSSKNRELSGSAHVTVLGVLTALFISGGIYLYSVNQSAVQGYHIRTAEKEIAQLKQQNTELEISEADLRSLYRIEQSSEELNMQKVESVKYMEQHGPVALR
jgi:hypothetical protein